MTKHVCGQCTHAFASEDLYLNHRCPATGSTPQHSQPELSKLSEIDIVAAVAASRRRKNVRG